MLYKKEVMEDNKKLKEENRLLKILCNKYEEEHKTTFETWQRDIKKLEEISQYVNIDKNCVPKHIKDYINNLLDKEVN